jgi:hypothetical protein
VHTAPLVVVDDHQTEGKKKWKEHNRQEVAQGDDDDLMGAVVAFGKVQGRALDELIFDLTQFDVNLVLHYLK